MKDKIAEVICEILAEKVIKLEEELKYQKVLNSILEEKIEKMTEEKKDA